MKIILNGEEIVIDKGFSIKNLLERFALEPKKIAVEKNLEIVSRSKFESTLINEGDRIEIIHFIGGG